MQKCCLEKIIIRIGCIIMYANHNHKVIIIINSCLLEYMNRSLINNYYAFNNDLIIIHVEKASRDMNHEVRLMYLF